VEDLWEQYTPASKRLVDALFEGRDPSPRDVSTVRQVLHVYLRRLNLDADAREDIIQETLLLLISGVRRGIVDRTGNLAAFIRTIALNCMRDAGRYRSRRPIVASDHLPEPIAEDGLARLLDAMASAEQVQAGLAAATEAGELDLVGFISEWLTLAERRGEAPSLREAAEELGTNHMHVSREIARFARYVPH
jgi:DNA-directed RNA polymerase specialized sigma24 family protein